MLRESLRALLEHPPRFAWVGGWQGGAAAYAALVEAAPDVLLLDIQLGTENGIDLLPGLKQLRPQMQIMMLTVYENTENIFRALQAGATGYLVKRTSSQRLLEAIEELNAGESPMSGHIARRLVEALAPAVTPPKDPPIVADTLTPREVDVLRCLAEGCLYKEAADKLGLTIHTVRTHVRSIYEKLQVRTRTEAVVKFLENR